MKKNVFCITGLGCLAALLLCACPPADSIDYEVYGPLGFVLDKIIYFDNQSSVSETNIDENRDSRINDFQRGGPEGPLFGLSTEYDHTTDIIGAPFSVIGKSFRWTNRTSLSERVKFDTIFAPADIGKEYYISLWVYSDEPAQVRLGAFSLSGRIRETLWAANPKEHSQNIFIGSGWNELVWAGYVHEDVQITQLGFEQVGGTAVKEFFIDDIMLWTKEK